MRKPQKSVEKQNALIRTEKIAREARQRSLQNAGNAPPASSGPPGGPPGGGLLTPGLLLTGGPSYYMAESENTAAAYAAPRGTSGVIIVLRCMREFGEVSF